MNVYDMKNFLRVVAVFLLGLVVGFVMQCDTAEAVKAHPFHYAQGGSPKDMDGRNPSVLGDGDMAWIFGEKGLIFFLYDLDDDSPFAWDQPPYRIFPKPEPTTDIDPGAWKALFAMVDRWSISGLRVGVTTQSMPPASENDLIFVTQGRAIDTDYRYMIEIPYAGMRKKITKGETWTAGFDGYGLAPGMTLTAQMGMHVCAIYNATTGASDVCVDDSGDCDDCTTGTMSSWANYRWLGSFIMDPTGAKNYIPPFITLGDGHFQEMWYYTPVEIATASPSSYTVFDQLLFDDDVAKYCEGILFGSAGAISTIRLSNNGTYVQTVFGGTSVDSDKGGLSELYDVEDAHPTFIGFGKTNESDLWWNTAGTSTTLSIRAWRFWR